MGGRGSGRRPLSESERRRPISLLLSPREIDRGKQAAIRLGFPTFSAFVRDAIARAITDCM